MEGKESLAETKGWRIERDKAHWDEGCGGRQEEEGRFLFLERTIATTR